MTCNKFVKILILACCTALLASCGKRPIDEISYGEIVNSVYKNEYFRLSVPLPADWSVQDHAAQQRLRESGRALLAGDDKQKTAMLKASEQRSVNLFAAFKFPMGSPVASNPSVLAVAELVRDMPGIKRGSDYLFHAKKLLEAAPVKLEIDKDMTRVSRDGVDFDVMHVAMDSGGVTVHQDYNAAIVKGYALVLIVSSTNDAEHAELESILSGVRFGK